MTLLQRHMSMRGRGDIAGKAGQLPMRLLEVTHRYGAHLLVDEAHSLSVLGERGCGLAEAEGLLSEVDFIVGTFSKSLGAVGGYCVSTWKASTPFA
jgi:7-keto-8-aminopelargonate synthetase-like enzyme